MFSFFILFGLVGILCWFVSVYGLFYLISNINNELDEYTSHSGGDAYSLL